MDVKEHSTLPEFNDKPPSFFDKMIDGFVNSFGSKTHFFLATIGAAFVVYMIFQQGYNKWLLTTGLASNNWESAIEYFLAVATLYQTARITIKQKMQSDHLQKETDEIDGLLKKNNDLTAQIHSMALAQTEHIKATEERWAKEDAKHKK